MIHNNVTPLEGEGIKDFVKAAILGKSTTMGSKIVQNDMKSHKSLKGISECTLLSILNRFKRNKKLLAKKWKVQM